MRITLVQQGLIVQQEFAKLLMMGSKGRIELAPPLTDDERRDYEIHVRGQYGFGMAVQVKSTMALRRLGGNARYLGIYFKVRATRLVNDPLYWYFFAYLDPKLMRFADPVFLVPSSELHRRAEVGRHGSFRTFGFQASTEPNSRDQWHQFRVNTPQLGQKMLEVMADLRRRRKLGEPSAAVLTIPDSVRVQLAKGGGRTQPHKRAA
jgi:hypothetical protein